MAELEKTIKGLECCTYDLPLDNKVHKSDICKNCPYYNPETSLCLNTDYLMKDALELLKEQPKIIHCKDCKWSWHINPDEDTPFYVCQNPMLCNMRISHEGDWHCGYGELKDGEHE